MRRELILFCTARWHFGLITLFLPLFVTVIANANNRAPRYRIEIAKEAEWKDIGEASLLPLNESPFSTNIWELWWHGTTGNTSRFMQCLPRPTDVVLSVESNAEKANQIKAGIHDRLETALKQLSLEKIRIPKLPKGWAPKWGDKIPEVVQFFTKTIRGFRTSDQAPTSSLTPGNNRITQLVKQTPDLTIGEPCLSREGDQNPARKVLLRHSDTEMVFLIWELKDSSPTSYQFLRLTPLPAAEPLRTKDHQVQLRPNTSRVRARFLESPLPFDTNTIFQISRPVSPRARVAGTGFFISADGHLLTSRHFFSEECLQQSICAVDLDFQNLRNQQEQTDPDRAVFRRVSSLDLHILQDLRGLDVVHAVLDPNSLNQVLDELEISRLPFFETARSFMSQQVQVWGFPEDHKELTFSQGYNVIFNNGKRQFKMLSSTLAEWGDRIVVSALGTYGNSGSPALTFTDGKIKLIGVVYGQYPKFDTDSSYLSELYIVPITKVFESNELKEESSQNI